MPFQMPQLQDNIGNALANIGQIRQQRTQNALAERQAGLQEREAAQRDQQLRRQQQEFDTAQQTAAQERQRAALADVFNAVEQGKTPERAMQIGASIMQSPEWQARFGQGGDTLAQKMLANPDAWKPENIRTAAAKFGIRLRSQELADMATEARVKRAPTQPQYRMVQDADRGYVRVDLGTGERTSLGFSALAPVPQAPVSVTYQAAPTTLMDLATGQPVLGRFNPKTGGYERADVPGGLAPVQPAPPTMTEGQSKALLFGSRMREANGIFDQLATEGVTTLPLGYRAASETPILGAAVIGNASETTQSLDQAQRDFINATLRRESGASISQPEFDNADRQYFPQPGDGPRVIEQKRRNRQLAEQGILAEVPESRRNSVQPRPDANKPRAAGTPADPVRVTSPAEAQALPKGTVFITPDGRTRVRQ